MRMIGVRAGPLRTEEPNSGSGFVAAYEYADALFRAGLWSARYGDRIWLGYDGTDLSYDFSLNGGLGVFLPLGAHHGPVFRAALRSEALQIAGLNLTQVALPAAEVGYSYLRGPSEFELVGLIGPSLGGELRRGASRLDLSGLLWGGAMTIRWQALSISLDAVFTELPDSQRMMRSVAHVCGILGGRVGDQPKDPVVRSASDARKMRASLCADMSSIQHWAGASGIEGPSLASVGLSLLFGYASRLYTPDGSGL